MLRFLIAVLTAITCSLSLGLKPETGHAQKPAQTVTRALEKVTIDTSSYRPGMGVEAEIPTTAYRFSVDGGPYDENHFLLFDLDGNGTFTPGKDGLAMEKFPFVVHLPRKLLLPVGQAKFKVEGTTLRLTIEDLGIPFSLVREASFLTNLRIRSAARPVVLSGEASKHARWHCDYLNRNVQSPGEGVALLSLHEEKPGKPGYTEEGARAGRRSSISPEEESYTEALWELYRTAYHGQPMTDPTLRVVGVAQRHGYSLLYFYEKAEEKARPYVFPPDGATHVPLRFNSVGEVPDPRPRVGEFGMPVYLYLPPEFRFKDKWYAPSWYLFEKGLPPKARGSIGGTYLSPEDPPESVRRAHAKGFIESADNYGLLLYIPNNPLKPNTTYQAFIPFNQQPAKKWSFTTRHSAPAEWQDSQ